MILAAAAGENSDEPRAVVRSTLCTSPPESVRDWPAFPDSAAALRRLRRRFRLGVITNCDTDLFAASRERLGVELDWVVTAERRPPSALWTPEVRTQAGLRTTADWYRAEGWLR